MTRHYNLRGPVRACRFERTWYSHRCGADTCALEEHHDITETAFDRAGTLLSSRHQNPDGSRSATTWEYGEAGELLAIKWEDASGATALRRHEYDASGRLLRVVARAPEGGERIDETYDYDVDGRRTKTVHINGDVPTSGTCGTGCYFWGVEVTDTGYSAPGAARIVTQYDDRDLPAALLFRDASGTEVSRVDFAYDDNGRLVEESQTMRLESMFGQTEGEMNPAQLETMRAFVNPMSRRHHRYDAHGRRVETVSSTFGTMGTDRKTMVYNEHGDQIEEVTEDERRGFNVGDEGQVTETEHNVHRSEARFRYVYDAGGNWIEKIVEARHGDGAFRMSSIERRTLTYYE